MFKRYYIIYITLFCSAMTFGDVTLPSILSDNMALEQKSEVLIWGWADANEKISVEASWNAAGTETSSAIADKQGEWRCYLTTPKAGGPYTITVKGNNIITIRNVIIGEVWLCSGQSNMSMPLNGYGETMPIENGKKEIANSANKSIRLFNVEHKISDKPLDDLTGKWVVCSPDNTGAFSAVGYYFSKMLNERTGYPVGMICSAWGGTRIQAWMRVNYMDCDDVLSGIFPNYQSRVQGWNTHVENLKEEGKEVPSMATGGARDNDRPASIYNAMISPLVNYKIKGVLWYQGESDAGVGDLYRRELPTLIKNWRCDFKNSQLPFYFVQLANFTKQAPGVAVERYQGLPRESSWAELREAQFMANSLKYTGMAVAIDLGQGNNIHPPNKKEVANRLLLWALANDYGKDIEYSGPIYQGYWREGDTIRLSFSNISDGLVFKDGTPGGFAIAGKDKNFVWADAKIDGDTIVVSSKEIKEPVAVRYAWDMDPDICIYNSQGLPASPFRTDNWEGVSLGKY